MAPETYHDDMRSHLGQDQARIARGIDAIQEIEANAEKYQPGVLADLLSNVKAACGHEKCTIAAEYMGNARPDPTP